MPTKRQFLLSSGLLSFFLSILILYSCFDRSQNFEEVTGRVITHDKFEKKDQVFFYPAIEFQFKGEKKTLNLLEPTNLSNGEKFLLFYDTEKKKLTTHSPWADAFYAIVLIFIGWTLFFMGLMQKDTKSS